MPYPVIDSSNVDCGTPENLQEMVLQAVHQFMQSPQNSQLNIQITFNPSLENPSASIPTLELRNVKDETLKFFYESLRSEGNLRVMKAIKPELSVTASRTRCPKCREGQNFRG